MAFLFRQKIKFSEKRHHFVSLPNDLKIGLMIQKFIKETRNINKTMILCEGY